MGDVEKTQIKQESGTLSTVSSQAQLTTDPKEEVEDPWALPELRDDSTQWKDLDTAGRVKRVGWTVLRLVVLLGLLYLFICSLDFMSSAFRLLGGKAAGEALSNSELLTNPVAGLMIGVMATVLVQSSSTSTSIVVSMVSAQLLSVRSAIPIVMGANIGSTVTNTLVAMGQAGNRAEFRRAFAAATVHDMFNWLNVLVFLPVEVASGMLFRLSALTTAGIPEGSDTENPEMLKVITKPFTGTIIELDSKLLNDIAQGDTEISTLIKSCCHQDNATCLEKCHHLFVDTSLTDAAAGAIMLIVSLVTLCVCLVLIVKVLHSLLRGAIAKVIKRVIHAEFPGPLKYLTGYFVILVGAGLTFLVQSSSIFTSSITPLVGIGVIHIDRMYPLTLGSNLGTTGTSLLAAMASSSSGFRSSLQIAFCHLYFNVVGILLWYPIPLLRRVPIRLARHLGNTTAKYRWFAVFYLLVVFLLFPLVVFALSLAGWQVLAGVGIPIVVLVIFIAVVNVLQRKASHRLPWRLQSWENLGIPRPLRSLQPYDDVIASARQAISRLRKKTTKGEGEGEGEGEQDRGASSTDTSDELNDVQIDGAFQNKVFVENAPRLNPDEFMKTRL